MDNCNILNSIKNKIFKEYGIKAYNINTMTMGVGGDTYVVKSEDEKYIYKESFTDNMNHPELEANLCDLLLKNNIPVPQYIRNKTNNYFFKEDNGKIGQMYHFIEGNVFKQNTAPKWFISNSSVLLADIHQALKSYEVLPEGLGKGFFQYMTPEVARESYRQSIKLAEENGQVDILEDLEFRYNLTEKIKGLKFDIDKLTYCNTHGDFTVNQIVCGNSKIKAVIDWTCACRHPAVWEITRSFFYAHPSCINGSYDENAFQNYVDGYLSAADLNQYDKDHLLSIYYYQLAVCDYYSQYLHAEESKKAEYLSQAVFATKVLKECQGIL